MKPENGQSADQNAPAGAPDWLAFLRSREGTARLEIDRLASGDVLLVETGNTRYRIEVSDPDSRAVMVTPDREDRPRGEMTLSGCTFGASSTIAPDHLFCGGNLELGFRTPAGVRGTHTTSEIRKVVLIRRSPGAEE